MKTKEIIVDTEGKRIAYLELLRIFASFMVIVAHTIMKIYLEWTPSVTWFVSIAYVLLAVSSVPIFFMITGYTLLGRRESYKKVFQRVIKMGIVLVVFSTFYYLVDERKDANLSVMNWVKALLNGDVQYAYWYIYAYLGILVMLPFLQKLAGILSQKDLWLYFAISIGFFSIWPIIRHYSSISVTSSFGIPIFGPYLCMLFIGHYFSVYVKPSKKGCMMAVILLVSALACNVILTYGEYIRNSGTDYMYFGDISTFFVLLESVCIFYIASMINISGKAAKMITYIGSHTFGIYLLHMFFVERLEFIFYGVSKVSHPLVGMLVYEICVFAGSLAATFFLRRLPVFRKLI